MGKERFGLTWPGKADCFRTIQAPSLATLRPSKPRTIRGYDNEPHPTPHLWRTDGSPTALREGGVGARRTVELP